MNEHDTIELFVLKCASARLAVEKAIPKERTAFQSAEQEAQIKASVQQFLPRFGTTRT